MTNDEYRWMTKGDVIWGYSSFVIRHSSFVDESPTASHYSAAGFFSFLSIHNTMGAAMYTVL